MHIFRELYEYREMIFGLVRRELRGRYKASVLGFMWTLINRLLQLAVYTLLFSVIMRSQISHYYLHLFVALVPWIFFSSSVAGGTTCIVRSKEMVKKIYFPREVLPISFVFSAFVNMLLSFIIIFGVIIIVGWGVSFQALLYLPAVMFVELVLALGMAMLSSAITVYIRDLEPILGIVTMAWMYATPVVYPLSQVPESLQKWYFLNPMTSIITAFRDILYFKQPPAMNLLLHALIFGVVILVIGSITFRRIQKGFAEQL